MNWFEYEFGPTALKGYKLHKSGGICMVCIGLANHPVTLYISYHICSVFVLRVMPVSGSN